MSCKVITSGEAITVSSVNIGLIPSEEGGEAVTTESGDMTSGGGGEAGSTKPGKVSSTVRI